MDLSTVEIHQIRNAIFLNTFPSKDIEIVGTIFHITFSPEPVPFKVEDILNYFTPLISIDNASGKDFLCALPFPLFTSLSIDYFEFHRDTSSVLFESIKTFTETAESMNAWDIFKQVGPEYSITLEEKVLNSFQYVWVLHNIRKDTVRKHDLIHSVIDVLKPWLNPELYTRVNEKEGATRENYMFDDPEFEKELLRKADTILKEKKLESIQQVPNEDLDIIEIEENNG